MSVKAKICLSLMIGLVISIVFNTVSFAKECENVRDNVLRLHVIAASDDKADQELKLKVRDTLLNEGAAIFDGSVTVQNAVSEITPQIEYLEKKAEETVRENGFDYSVKITLKREYYDTRIYDDFTMPAGEYLSLKAVIGDGKGHNWWCVMFPALCLPAAQANTDAQAVLGEDGYSLIKRDPQFEIRFKIVELFEKIKKEN